MKSLRSGSWEFCNLVREGAGPLHEEDMDQREREQLGMQITSREGRNLVGGRKVGVSLEENSVAQCDSTVGKVLAQHGFNSQRPLWFL